MNKQGDKGGKGDKGQAKNHKGQGAKADSQVIFEAPPPVQEFPPTTHSIDSKIRVLGGTNFRKLRDGLSLCSPGIVEPAKRQRKPCWKLLSQLLLEVCDHNILTSEVIRSTNLFSVLQENFLDEGCKSSWISIEIPKEDGGRGR